MNNNRFLTGWEKEEMSIWIGQNAEDKLKSLIDFWHIEIGVYKPAQYGVCNIDKIKEEIEKLLIEILPHGSGIDADWHFKFCKNGTIFAYNSYHAMDDSGSYIKWINFSIRFFRHKRNEYNKLQGPLCDKYQILHKKYDLDYKIYAPNNDKYSYMLRNYLEDTVSSCLNNFVNHYNDIITKDKIKKPYKITV